MFILTGLLFFGRKSNPAPHASQSLFLKETMRDVRNRRSLATLLLLPLLAQCHERTLTEPGLPDEIRATAIRMHVDLKAGTVAPVQNRANSDISYSLVGSDGVSLQTSNLSQTPLSGNRVLVRFDVAISNTLSNVILTKSTVPTPPAGVTGVVLFPFQATVTLGPASTITPSTDWDGAPFNFFNDVNCTGSPNSDCFRWEEYSAPLAPGATSAARTVGFEINKDVQSFDVVMLVAADLLNVTPAPAALAVTPATVEMTSTNGEWEPASIFVYNNGGGTITGLTATVDYAAGQPTGWLSTSLSSTTAPSTLTLLLTPVALAEGTYNATVSVASAGVSNSPQTVAVTLYVTAPPVATAIYVSESDETAVDDGSCGSHPAVSPGGHPCRSIAQGLSRAVAMGRPEVRVADGRYNEAVTLVNGKNLLGGYNPKTWQRHVSTTNTVIEGVSSSFNHDRTIIASGITSPTVFEGFVVRGSHNTKVAGNSYAIYVSGSTANLEIRGNVIHGGTGGPGPQGTSAFGGGASTSDGIGRTSGNAATYDAKITTGSDQCDASNTRNHTNGGIWIAGVDNISGGNGGGNSCPTSSTLTEMSAADGLAGQPGAGPGGGTGGLGGAGGFDFRLESSGTVCVVAVGSSQVGTNGGHGGNGANGSAVSGATSGAGTVVGSHWVGAPGTTGSIGSNGGGGGGGGAGGGAYWVAPPDGKDHLGGHGGGGGAGGNGGGAGGAGAAGGGAFGIFIVGDAPVVSDNAIVRGTGGTGGSGGTGGVGLNGGRGAPGGLSEIFCAGAAGRGGDGGRGGFGSGGGGGAGGASYGIYTSGAGTPNYCTTANNTINGGTAGAGGPGGSSPGNAGGAGVSGALATCSFQ